MRDISMEGRTREREGGSGVEVQSLGRARKVARCVDGRRSPGNPGPGQ